MHLSGRLVAPLALALLTVAALFTSAPRPASALMMESESLEGGGGGGGGYYSPPPPTANKIVYLHGRSMNGWPSKALLAQGGAWQHVTLNYNGSDRLTASTPRNAVKSALLNNCRGDNQCVVVCYSAGCARMLLALDDLNAAGTPANRVLWITAAGSAAGGSEAADAGTRWWVKLLAKIFGGAAAIDNDLKVGTMRSSFGYIQNRAPVSMYHLAGSRDMCRKVAWVFKVCGNKYMPGRTGDGAVPPHSSCGYANRGTYYNCGGAGKYTNRQAQQSALYYSDHRDIVADAVRAASYRLGSTATISIAPFGELTSEPDANETYEDADERADRADQLTDGEPLGYTSTYDHSAVATHTCQDGYCDQMSNGSATSSGYSSGTGDPNSSTMCTQIQ